MTTTKPVIFLQKNWQQELVNAFESCSPEDRFEMLDHILEIKKLIKDGIAVVKEGK